MPSPKAGKGRRGKTSRDSTRTRAIELFAAVMSHSLKGESGAGGGGRGAFPTVPACLLALRTVDEAGEGPAFRQLHHHASAGGEAQQRPRSAQLTNRDTSRKYTCPPLPAEVARRIYPAHVGGVRALRETEEVDDVRVAQAAKDLRLRSAARGGMKRCAVAGGTGERTAK